MSSCRLFNTFLYLLVFEVFDALPTEGNLSTYSLLPYLAIGANWRQRWFQWLFIKSMWRQRKGKAPTFETTWVFFRTTSFSGLFLFSFDLLPAATWKWQWLVIYLGRPTWLCEDEDECRGDFPVFEDVPAGVWLFRTSCCCWCCNCCCCFFAFFALRSCSLQLEGWVFIWKIPKCDNFQSNLWWKPWTKVGDILFDDAIIVVSHTNAVKVIPFKVNLKFVVMVKYQELTHQWRQVSQLMVSPTNVEPPHTRQIVSSTPITKDWPTQQKVIPKLSQFLKGAHRKIIYLCNIDQFLTYITGVSQKLQQIDGGDKYVKDTNNSCPIT